MYNLNRLKTQLMGLVGFKQTRNPAFGLLSNDLLESRSGLFVEDVHPLLSKENIHAAINTEEYKYYPAWGEFETGYSHGTLVTHKGAIYRNVLEGNASEPDADTNATWEHTSIMSIYLRETMQTAIVEALNLFQSKKKSEYQTKTLFEDVQLFSGTGNRLHKVIKQNRFVGLEIDLKNYRDVVLKINRIGLQIDTPNPEFRVYLYHVGTPEPIRFWDFSIDRAGLFQWFPIDLELSMSNETANQTGGYVLGYFESDFSGQAIEVQQDLLKGPCMSCNTYDKNAFASYSPFVNIHPFSVSNSFFDGELLTDMNAQGYHYNTNFGMNLAFTSVCDLTDFAIRHESLFSDVIAKNCALHLLRGIAFSTQNKGLTNQIKDLARYELDNKENNTSGLQTQFEITLNALNFDLSDLNSICLPTVQPKRIRHSAM